jgi:hypothetical protein
VTKREKDGQHPASHYLVVADPKSPGTWHLRVLDITGKPDHGLMGAAWAALHKGYRGQQYAGPSKTAALKKLSGLYRSEGMETPAVMMSAFTLAPAAVHQGDLVVRRGKVFEAGDYPDKSFSLTSEELRAAVAAFEPVPIDLEHMSTPLDGKLGTLTSVEMGDDGFSLFGTVALPAWLDALLEGTGRKVSATWDRTTKTLLGLALVNTPRITDAALMAAFAAAVPHKTNEGVHVIQAVHDMTAKSGAVCTPSNPNGTQAYSTSYFHSAAEAKNIQALHDASTAAGAKCSAQSSTSMLAVMADLAFSGSRHSKGDLADIQSIHDLAAKQGADCATSMAGIVDPARRATSQAHGNTAALGSGKGKAMSFGDTVSARFKDLVKLGRGGRDLVRDAGGDIPGEDVFAVVDESAKFAADEARATEMTRIAADRTAKLAEIEDLKKESLRLRVAHMTDDAVNFADKLILENRIVPAQKDALVASLVLAATDDATQGVVKFADGKEGTRVEATKKLWASMPPLGLTGEKLKALQTAGFNVTPADGSGNGADDMAAARKRREHLLEQTTQGRAHLQKQAKGAKV